MVVQVANDFLPHFGCVCVALLDALAEIANFELKGGGEDAGGF